MVDMGDVISAVQAYGDARVAEDRDARHTAEMDAIAALSAKIDALTAPTEPAPEPTPTLTIGATAHRLDEPKPDSTRWANGLIGPIGATRVFETDLPATWEPMCPDLPDMQEIISYKSATAANVASYVASMRPGDLLCFHHEPEGPNDYADGAAFVAAWNEQHAMVEAAGGQLGMTAGSYQYRSGGRGADGSFLPDPAKCAWYSVDDYQGGGADGEYGHIDSYASGANGQFWGWYNLVKDLGRPLLVTEYGRGSRDREPYATEQRLAVIPQDEAWLTAAGFTHWIYWYEDSQNGVPEPGKQWVFDDQESIDLWAGLAAKYNT